MSDNQEQKYHVYDGIIEHNNPMPAWWLWTFILTVVFGGIYYIHYEIAGGPTLKDELAISMKEFEKIKQAASLQFPNYSENELLEKFNSATATDLATQTITARCVVCHGEKLEGKVGPNLLDKEWKNGTGTGPEIVNIIRHGVPDKGMPPWEGVLKKDEILSIASYLVSHKVK